MRIGKIASRVEYRIEEQFQNCQFLEPNFDINLKIYLFSILDNYENFKMGKYEKNSIWKFKKFAISKIRKISKISQFQKI